MNLGLEGLAGIEWAERESRWRASLSRGGKKGGERSARVCMWKCMGQNRQMEGQSYPEFQMPGVEKQFCTSSDNEEPMKALRRMLQAEAMVRDLPEELVDCAREAERQEGMKS